MMILRQATIEELELCTKAIEDAKVYQKELGFVQWSEKYPSRKDIEEDMKKNVGYVLCDGEKILGYCAVIIGDEPTYQVIDGSWKTNKTYGVIHRMAFRKDARGKGFASTCFALAKELCLEKGIHAMRVDTHENNKIMRHILEKQGYEYCGIITVSDGTPRFAYELDF